jgi:hypothetical protein
MIALLIEIDGQKYVLAGVEDWSLISAHLTAMRGVGGDSEAKNKEDEIDLSIGGLTRPDASKQKFHFRWARRELNVGSSVKITILDSQDCDPPIKRFRSDKEIQESAFTDDEMREMRRQDYLKLREEFGSKGDG